MKTGFIYTILLKLVITMYKERKKDHIRSKGRKNNEENNSKCNDFNK